MLMISWRKPISNHDPKLRFSIIPLSMSRVIQYSQAVFHFSEICNYHHSVFGKEEETCHYKKPNLRTVGRISCWHYIHMYSYILHLYNYIVKKLWQALNRTLNECGFRP